MSAFYNSEKYGKFCCTRHYYFNTYSYIMAQKLSRCIKHQFHFPTASMLSLLLPSPTAMMLGYRPPRSRFFLDFLGDLFVFNSMFWEKKS